jgi:hypothetical protein
MNNPLNIVEPSLLALHQKVEQTLNLNGIQFTATYYREEDPKFNSSVRYHTEIPFRVGFIVSNKGEFGGAVVKSYKGNKDGSSEPVFASASCVMAFVGMFAIDKIKELKFGDELIKEFDALNKNDKSKK